MQEPIHPDSDDSIDIDPLEPYATTPVMMNHDTLPSEALLLAHSFFCAYHQDTPALLKGAKNALQALQKRQWCITADGALEIPGSQGDTYLTDDDGCRLKGQYKRTKTGKRSIIWCKSFILHQKRHQGQCYHMIARELVRLAQLLGGH